MKPEKETPSCRSADRGPCCPKCGSTDVSLTRVRWGRRMIECLNFNCERDSRKGRK